MEAERDLPNADLASSKSAAVTGLGSEFSSPTSVVADSHDHAEPRRSTRKRKIKRFSSWSDRDESSRSRDKDRKRVKKELLTVSNRLFVLGKPGKGCVETKRQTKKKAKGCDEPDDDYTNDSCLDSELCHNVNNCINEEKSPAGTETSSNQNQCRQLAESSHLVKECAVKERPVNSNKTKQLRNNNNRKHLEPTAPFGSVGEGLGNRERQRNGGKLNKKLMSNYDNSNVSDISSESSLNIEKCSNVENVKNAGTSGDGNEHFADQVPVVNVENYINENGKRVMSEITGVCDDDDIDRCKNRQECVESDNDKTKSDPADTEVDKPASAVVKIIKSRLKRPTKRKINSRLLNLESDDNAEVNGKIAKKKRKANLEHRCSVCDKVMARSADLAKHMLVHTGEKPFECDVCGKRFSQAGNMKEHKRTHSGERPFKCEVCEKAFVRACDLRAHKVTHSTEKPFSCDKCSKSFASAHYLKSHQKLHSKDKPFSCDKCGISFHRASTLWSHKITHNDVKSYQCDLCSKAFRTLGNLKDHKSVHSGARPYTCEICEKTFTKKCSLKKHMFLHVDERPFSCSVCGKGYSTKAELEIHVRTHTGERPFKCDQCSADFHRKANLQLHISSIHLGIRQHVCEICGKAFAENRSLKEHQLIHSGEKPHECNICGKAFTQSSSLKAHVRSHSGEKPYSCKFCLKTFAHLSTRNRHVLLHTGEKPYKCCFCSAGFARLDVLKEHKRVEHNPDKTKSKKVIFSRAEGDHSYDIRKGPTVVVLPSGKDDQSLQVIKEEQSLQVIKEEQLVQVVKEDQPVQIIRQDQLLQVVKKDQSFLVVGEDQSLQVVEDKASTAEQFEISVRDGALIITNGTEEYSVDISSIVSSTNSSVHLALDGTYVIASGSTQTSSYVETVHVKRDASEMTSMKIHLVDGDTSALEENVTGQQFVLEDMPKSDVTVSKRHPDNVVTGAEIGEHRTAGNSEITETHICQHCELSNSVVIKTQGNECDDGFKPVKIKVSDDLKTEPIIAEIGRYDDQEDSVITGLTTDNPSDKNLISAVVEPLPNTDDGHQGASIIEPSGSQNENDETDFVVVQHDSQFDQMMTGLTSNEQNSLVELSGNQQGNVQIVVLEGGHFDEHLEPGTVMQQAQGFECSTADSESLQVYHLSDFSAADIAQLVKGGVLSIQSTVDSQIAESKGLLTSSDPQSHVNQNGEIQSDNFEGIELTMSAKEHSYFGEGENCQPDIISVVKTNSENCGTSELSGTQATILRDLLTHVLSSDSTKAQTSMHSPKKHCKHQHVVDTKITVNGLRQKKRSYGALPKSWFCEVCGKGFTQASSLKKHQVLLHSKDKPFICSTCDKVCFCKSDLEAHMRIHSGERPFKCPFCGTFLRRKANLEQHISAVHMQQRPHVCDICSQGFTEARSLKDHKLIHTGTRPHRCHCGKAFTQLGTLKKHERTHIVEKLYMCSHCQSYFTERAALQQHVCKQAGDKEAAATCV